MCTFLCLAVCVRFMSVSYEFNFFSSAVSNVCKWSKGQAKRDRELPRVEE